MSALPSSLVRDPDSLGDGSDRPIQRDKQLDELRTCLFSVLGSKKPFHAWIYGPPGSGKTFSIRYLLDREVPKHGLLPVYINCRERFTFLDMVEQILVEGKGLRDPCRTRERQLDLLRRSLGNRRCVICLDEIDLLCADDVGDLLSHLCSLPQASVVCISSTRQAMLNLPTTAISRLAPRQIPFPAYAEQDIVRILEQCVRSALVSDSWTAASLEAISQQARGDARRALALLRHAVQRADEERALILESKHLQPGNFEHFKPHAEDELACLTLHHQMLYDLVCRKAPMAIMALEEAYRDKCHREHITPVSSRTVNKYLGVLCLKRLLQRETGAGTSGWIYRPSPSFELR